MQHRVNLYICAARQPGTGIVWKPFLLFSIAMTLDFRDYEKNSSDSSSSDVSDFEDEDSEMEQDEIASAHGTSITQCIHQNMHHLMCSYHTKPKNL